MPKDQHVVFPSPHLQAALSPEVPAFSSGMASRAGVGAGCEEGTAQRQGALHRGSCFGFSTLFVFRMFYFSLKSHAFKQQSEAKAGLPHSQCLNFEANINLLEMLLSTLCSENSVRSQVITKEHIQEQSCNE